MSESQRPWLSEPPAIVAHAVAVLSVVAALTAAWWIEQRWESVPHVSLFLCAVMFSAWFGGIGPGLLAGVLSIVAFNYYFLSPIHSLAVNLEELPRLVFFALSAFFVGSLSAAQKRATQSLQEARDKLRRTVEELERINEALQRENTERKQAQDELQKAQSELARISRVTTLGELAASIAHETNQPLGAIVNNAGACLRWLANNNLEEARRSAELVRADGHRAGEIIQRIRSFAKKAPPQKGWIDIHQIIREVIALMHSEIQRQGIALEMELSEDMQAPVFADRVQLQQVVLNLVMNAVEAMSETSDGRRRLLIRTITDGAGVVAVSVRDSGPGLKLENLDRLFTPFYTTKPQGMGMGLAICRSIVEAHGGKLWATINEGGGATFQFTLPTGGETAARPE